MELSMGSRALKRIGIKTKSFKAHEAMDARKSFLAQRRNHYLVHNKEEALLMHPELKEVFEAEETSLLFYQKVVGAHAKSLNTAHRNQQRSKEAGLEALRYLDKEKSVPVFKAEGRVADAQRVVLDELQQIRAGLMATFDKNAQVSLELKRNYQQNYAKYASAYFLDEKKAHQLYPELAMLSQTKKQARRYYKQWVLEKDVDSCVKDCLERNLDCLAKGLPMETAIEIKAHAKHLNQTMIGLSVSSAQVDKKAYDYQGTNLMKSLIGRNGLKTGLWPYKLDAQVECERIENVEHHLKLKQYTACFAGLSREELLEKFSELEPICQKYDAANRYFSQKTDKKTAELASSLLIEQDFEKIITNQPLMAVSEYTADALSEGLKRAEVQIQMNRDTEVVLNMKDDKEVVKNIAKLLDAYDLESSNDDLIKPHQSALSIDVNETSVFVEDILHDYFEAIDKGEYTRDELEYYLEEFFARNIVSETDQEKLTHFLMEEGCLGQTKEGSQESDEKLKTTEPKISIDRLHSTAPQINVSLMFETTHRAKKINLETKGNRWDIQQMELALNENAAALAITLLGEPVSSDKNQLRFGSNKGSLIITIDGDNKGKWYDHQKGIGGKLLNLIMHEKSCGFKEALDFAGDFLNLEPEPFIRQQINTSDMSGLSSQQTKSLAYARHLADLSEPIKGTLAETYLKVERGIDLDINHQNIRFISSVKEPDSQKNHPGLLVIGRTKDGQVSGVQVVYLDDNGKKLECDVPKRSYGLIKGAAIPVQNGSSVMAVAEGAETALSVASAYPDMTVFASLGSITNVSAIDFKAKGNTMLILADNDVNNPDTELKTSKAADEFQRKGFNVLMTKPEKEGHDFNDVLKEKGLDALKNELANLKVYGSQQELKTINETIAENRARAKEREDTKKHVKEREMDF